MTWKRINTQFMKNTKKKKNTRKQTNKKTPTTQAYYFQITEKSGKEKILKEAIGKSTSPVEE